MSELDETLEDEEVLVTTSWREDDIRALAPHLTTEQANDFLRTRAVDQELQRAMTEAGWMSLDFLLTDAIREGTLPMGEVLAVPDYDALVKRSTTEGLGL